MSSSPLLTTPLHSRHVALGARMVPFAGWDMPVEYSGITAEHMAVRARAGLFDVSHMGEIEIAGKDALAAVQRISSNDASRLQIGQAHYSGLLTPEGTFVDDLLVYRMAQNHFMLVVNASNAPRDFAWISEQIKPAGDAACIDSSGRYALIAVQGPAARDILQPLTGVELADIKYYWFAHGEVANARATVSRTGYTGEDGFEIFVPPNMAGQVWDALMESGRAVDMLPCGLGARDTLRLEAAMRLYGNDIDESTSALEADLGWIVGWKKDAFIGKDALASQKAAGVTRRLVGFEMVDRGIARHGYPVVRGDKPIGVVTSGTQTPYLKKAIGMAYVPIELSTEGSDIDIDIRGRVSRARVVPMPFYKRQRT
ncbi:MAG: glycine cleavage system aminomethyltransferase GcvT [Vicinamibacterales bacterium]